MAGGTAATLWPLKNGKHMLRKTERFFVLEDIIEKPDSIELSGLYLLERER